MTEQKRYGNTPAKAVESVPDENKKELVETNSPDTASMAGTEVISADLVGQANTTAADMDTETGTTEPQEDRVYTPDLAVNDINRIIGNVQTLGTDAAIQAIGKLRGAIIKLQD